MKWRTLAPSSAPKSRVQRQRIETPTFPNPNRRMQGKETRVTWRRQNRVAERITSTLGARPPGPGTGADRARSLARLAAVRFDLRLEADGAEARGQGRAAAIGEGRRRRVAESNGSVGKMLLAAPLALPLFVLFWLLSCRWGEEGGAGTTSSSFLPPARAAAGWIADGPSARLAPPIVCWCAARRGARATEITTWGPPSTGWGSLPTAGARALPDVRARARSRSLRVPSGAPRRLPREAGGMCVAGELGRGDRGSARVGERFWCWPDLFWSPTSNWANSAIPQHLDRLLTHPRRPSDRSHTWCHREIREIHKGQTH
jgi:hypothetical protein